MAKTEYDAHVFNNKFKCDLSDDITKISSITMTLDKIETTTGNHTQQKTYIPGGATFGSITFQGAEHKEGVKKIREWVKQAYDGVDCRKAITIELQNQKGEAVRTFNLHDCFPSAYSSVDLGSQSGGGTMTWVLEVRVTRVDMA